MIIRLANLKEDPRCPDALEFEEGAWAHIVETVRSLGVVDAETMERLAAPGPRLEVTQEQARKLGNGLGACLEKVLEAWLEKELVAKAKPPVIPSYIVPIAASNGVWIDPALPLLHQKPEFPTDLFNLTTFCQKCSGFSVN